MFSETQRHLQHPYPDRSDRTVTVSRKVYDDLAAQAAAWRELRAEIGEADALIGMLVESPGVREILMQEYVAWSERQDDATASHAAAGDRTWGNDPSQAELQRRRAQPGQLHRDYVARNGEYQGGPVEWSSSQPPAAAAA